jgi:hypothetical protein
MGFEDRRLGCAHLAQGAGAEVFDLFAGTS